MRWYEMPLLDAERRRWHVRLAYIAWLKGSVFFSCHISHTEFLSLIEPSNIVGQLLLSHLVAVQTLMGPTNQDERASRKVSQFVNVMARWLEIIHSNADPTMREYFEWPKKRAEKVRDWLQHEKALANWGYVECFRGKSDIDKSLMGQWSAR